MEIHSSFLPSALPPSGHTLIMGRVAHRGVPTMGGTMGGWGPGLYRKKVSQAYVFPVLCFLTGCNVTVPKDPATVTPLPRRTVT